MKIISNEEVKQIKLKKQSHEVIIKCSKLKVGEGLVVLQKEYTKKCPLHQLIGTSQNSSNGYLKLLNIKISTNTADFGWVLVRIK